MSLKFLDLQCRQAVAVTQLLVFLLEKPDLLGGCCGSDHPADLAIDPFANKIVITYPFH
jgi:hypothetical protein